MHSDRASAQAPQHEPSLQRLRELMDQVIPPVTYRCATPPTSAPAGGSRGYGSAPTSALLLS